MLREDLQNALKEAMKNHDTTTVSAVRLIIAGQKEKDDSIKIYVEGKRQDLADKEMAEIKVIEKFLPKQMNDEEMIAAIKEVIASVNASSMKDMGAVMGKLRSQYAGQMDFGKASGAIKSLLG